MTDEIKTEETAPEEIVEVTQTETIVDNITDDENKTKPEYVDKLRKENIKWRQNAKQSREESEKMKESLTAAEAKAQEALNRIDQMKAQTEDRLVNAELRAAATHIGLKKLEYAKLADLTKIEVHENGAVTGVNEALKSLKDSDPDLFQPATTSHPFPSPQPRTEAKARTADTMTAEEYQAAKKAFIRG